MNSRLEHAEHSASDVENEMDKMYPKTERAYMTKWGEKKSKCHGRWVHEASQGNSGWGNRGSVWENEHRKKSTGFKAHLHLEVERAKCLPGYKENLLFSREQTQT